jgi:putative methylase
MRLFSEGREAMPWTKKTLEIALERCREFPEPQIGLEQYTIPAPLAAELLHLAHLKGDIEGKRVYDLGCGTGRLAIGASLLGALEVVAVDLDGKALEIAVENAGRFDLDRIRWVRGNIKDISGKGDTVLQNPPFGVRRAGADRAFLEKALEIAPVVYTMHKGETRGFVTRYIEGLGGEITDILRVPFSLSHTYPFHRKERKEISVDLYRVVKGGR